MVRAPPSPSPALPQRALPRFCSAFRIVCKHTSRPRCWRMSSQLYSSPAAPQRAAKFLMRLT